MTFRLVCQPCGGEVLFEGDLTHSLEFAAAVDRAGWLLFQDNRRPGFVTFCSQRCAGLATTKNGFFRRDLGRGKAATGEE